MPDLIVEKQVEIIEADAQPKASVRKVAQDAGVSKSAVDKVLKVCSIYMLGLLRTVPM